MKSSRMSPGMNDMPPAAEDSGAENTKLSDFIAGLSDDECMQLQELLEEKLSADIDEDGEEGEPVAHAEKVLGNSDEVELE